MSSKFERASGIADTSFVYADTKHHVDEEMSAIVAVKARKELERLGDQLDANGKWRVWGQVGHCKM